MTRSELARAERTLRKDDNALRLRFSMTEPLVLIERKTYRGKVGALGPGGLVWGPDQGRRYEEGHVFVGSIPREGFSFHDLRDSLREADTWQKWNLAARPRWQVVEEADTRRRKQVKANRMDNLRYKASDFWDRYAWRTKARVSVL